MYDDDPFIDSDEFDDFEIDTARADRRRNFLFMLVSVILIFSLVGSSIVVFFVAAHQQSRTATAGRIERVRTDPTAAPGTVVAAVSTPLPTPVSEISLTTPAINRIVVINHEGQIETMSPAGDERRMLTQRSDRALFLIPAWAPDGRRLAVVGNTPAGGGIYVLEDTERTGLLADRQIYFSEDNPPFYLYWSPDGHHLAFLANYSRSLMSLNVVTGDGSEDSRLLATGSPFYWDWSRDGHQMLVHSGRNLSDGLLSLIDIDGRTMADNLAVPGEFQAPGIGWDGRYWAFAERAGDGLSALVVVDTRTGERQAYEQGSSVAFGWSPTHDRIAYTNGPLSGHPYWGPLRQLDVATGEVHLLSTQMVLAFFWSPDGRSIAFITLSNDANDDSINANKDSDRRLSRVATEPALQPNRSLLTLSVIDAESGAGMRLLDFMPTGVYLSQFLPYFDQYALSHRIWSPDSSAIVLPVREDDGNHILVVPVGGGRPYRLADGEIAFWSHN